LRTAAIFSGEQQQKIWKAENWTGADLAKYLYRSRSCQRNTSQLANELQQRLFGSDKVANQNLPWEDPGSNPASL
jgi:hypothetical protein